MGDCSIVRIVVLSDTHGLHQRLQLPPGDVLIHCGDFANRGSLEDVTSFSEWFKAQTNFKDRIVIAGNHDRDLKHPDAINLEKMFSSDTAGECAPIQFLQDQHCICAGGRLRIFGTSWNTCANDRYEDLDLKTDRVDLLLSHMPPYWPSRSSKVRRGSLSLAKTSFQNRIPITCGGHLHWARGAVQYMAETEDPGSPARLWFINASSQKPASNHHDQLEDDALVFPPIVIEYDAQRRQVVRIEGLDEHNMLEKKIPPPFR